MREAVSWGEALLIREGLIEVPPPLLKRDPPMLTRCPELVVAMDRLDIEKIPYTKESVLRSHRELSKRRHPDLGGTDHDQRKLNEARDICLEYLDEA